MAPGLASRTVLLCCWVDRGYDHWIGDSKGTLGPEDKVGRDMVDEPGGGRLGCPAIAQPQYHP